MTGSPAAPAFKYGRILGTFIRFLVSGGFNTALTYALYLLLLRFISYRISYTVAFIAGIALAYILNRFFVFRAKGGSYAFPLMAVVYLVQYLAGIVIVSFWVEILGWSASLAPLAAIALTIPLTFVLTRSIFVEKKALSDENQ